MSEVKGRIDREVSPSSSEAPAALSAGAAPAERPNKRAGTMSLSGWMGALLDQLSDDELPRS